MASTESLGARLLAEVGAESNGGRLEDLLRDLRNLHNGHPQESRGRVKNLGIPELEDLWKQNGSRRLEITGPGAATLLHQIVSTAVSAPRFGTIVVIDWDGRFDVTRLSCGLEDMRHIHIFSRGVAGLKQVLDSVEPYLLYGEHLSWDRELVAVVVSGAAGGDICTGWRGWLRVGVYGEGVLGFGMGMSMEEAMREKEQRMKAVEKRGWTASCEEGEYSWVNS